MKRRHILLASLLAMTAPAAAGDTFNTPTGKICLDPAQNYQAFYLKGSDNEIVAHQTFGRDHRMLRLSTTCIDLRDATTIRLATGFNCIAMGDEVFSNAMGGHRQSCRITRVEPYVPAQ